MKLSIGFKRIILALSISVCVIPSMGVFAESIKEKYDGKYTLSKIETSDGKIHLFEYGGEIYIEKNIVTFKTKSSDEIWNLNIENCDFDNNMLYETDPETNYRYTYEKVN
ncbi:MAG: hypothetical protein ACRDD7_04800 [Peptostreptococcaceae bacterium]